MTVNKIRERLGRILTPVFSAVFEAKYMILSDLPKDAAAKVVEQNFELAVAYIGGIASHLGDEGFYCLAAQSAPPEVIFTVYNIYWQITRFLSSQDQQRDIYVYDSDAFFLTYMFTDFLAEAARESQV